MAGGTSEDNPVGINVAAMVDIIFCLLLFFMCSLKFKELEGKMDSWLPENKGDKPSAVMNQPVEEIRVVLSFKRGGAEGKPELQRALRQRGIPPGREGDRLLEELVAKEYADHRSLGRADIPVIIDAGPAVPWQAIIDVMNLAKKLEIPKIEFAFGSAEKPAGS